MRGKKGFTLLTAIILLSCTQAFAWGAKGHQIVSFVGAELTSSQSNAFWSSNAESMRQLSTVPDRVWKHPATYQGEAPTHWFQVDAYISNGQNLQAFPKTYADAVSQYGEATIVKNGTALWRITQFYNDSVNAFKTGDDKGGLEYAAIMSHYIGDLSQPLHVSENYDGQETGNKGIHFWFETANIQDEMAIRDVVTQRAEALLQDPNFLNQFSGSLMDIEENETMRSIAYRDTILQNDTKYGRQSAQAHQVQLDLAESRMADGAATLAVILSKISADAGEVIRATPIPLEDPAWIAPDFSSGVAQMTPLYSSPLEDDCGLQ